MAQVSGGPFLPGDQVDVELICPAGKGASPKEVALDLVCRETFWYTVKSIGAAFVGNYPGRGEEHHTGLPYTAAGRPGRYKTSKELTCLSSPVALVNQDPDRASLRGFARFHLPTDAPPSILGNTACVEWELRARLGPMVSQDSNYLGKITVLSKTDASIGSQTRHHDSNDQPTKQVNLYLSLAESVVRTGQTLRGVLKAKARSDIQVTKIQVELECLEQAGAKQSTAVYATAGLQGRSMLQAGEEYQWPFELQLPNRLLPSINLSETSVVWRVKGNLGRTFRTRLETAAQVQVFTTG